VRAFQVVREQLSCHIRKALLIRFCVIIRWCVMLMLLIRLCAILILTLWEPAYNIFVLRFWPKNSIFWLPYQRPSSSADCSRELFKGSNGSASLVNCTRKKNFWLGVRIFCDWHHKWSSFGVILAHVAWPRAQPLGQSVSLKFSLETRLKSESFEPLIDFLAFLVQKLWSKMDRLINYLIS